MAIINSSGITIETLTQWKARLESLYLSVDPEWNVSANTPDGQILAGFAEILANADEVQLDSYNAGDPDKALGQALDAVMALSDAKRKAGTYSSAVVQLSGINTTNVPSGTQIKNSVTGTRWTLDSAVVLGAGPTNANVTCVTIGAQTAGIGELNQIATPVTGLQSVINAAAASVGLEEMSDQAARQFRIDTIAKPASNIIDAIYAAVAAVDGVSHVATYNNRTAAADSNGIPARNFAVIAKGGSDADVAQAIYSKLGPGPGMFGGSIPVTEVVSSTENNNTESITFGRPPAIPLYVEVFLTETGTFSDSIESEIKNALVDFSTGSLFSNNDAGGFRTKPFQIGEDISSGLLHTPVNYIVGRSGQGYVTAIYISDAALPSAAGTVAIDWDELASIDPANIEVTIT